MPWRSPPTGTASSAMPAGSCCASSPTSAGLTAALDGRTDPEGNVPAAQPGHGRWSRRRSRSRWAPPRWPTSPSWASSPRSWGGAVRLDCPPGPGPGHRPDPGRIAQARARIREHVWALIEATPAGSPGWPSRGRSWRAGWSSTWTPPWSPRTPTRREQLPPGRRATASTRSAAWCIEYPRVPGHAPAPRQRRLEHLHRPQRGPGRRAEAGPGRVPPEGPGPHRRRRGQPRAHRAPAHPVLASARPCCSPAAGPSPTPTRTPSRPSPTSAWKPGLRQDGGTEDDKDVAEITHLHEPGRRTGPTGSASSPAG